jgi:YD repeat-containing protein
MQCASTSRRARIRLFSAAGAGALLLSASSVAAGNIAYTYDELGRVTSATYSTGEVVNYSYDPAGNRTLLSANASNQPPTAVNDSITTPQNTAKTFDPRTNDTDPESDPLSITAKTNGSKGVVTIGGTTSLTYTPNTGQTGSDSFTYTISDGQSTSTGTVSVTITAANQPPNAVNDTSTTAFNTAKTFDPRTNDTDPDGNPLTITAKTNGASGTVTINSGASLTYTPNVGFSGLDSFTYTISDGQGGTDTATVSMTVSAATNQPPNAVNDSITTPQNVAKTFDPRTNDSDPEGNPLSVSAKTNGAHGTVVINSGVSLTYTPASGYSGADSFTYTISDGQGGTDTATVSVTVSPAANQPPVAVDDSYDIVTPIGAGSQTATLYVLTNDSDPNGNPLTITALTTPTNYATAVIQSGNRVYVTGIRIGTTTFNYTISDGQGGTDVGMVTIVRTLDPDSCGQICP